MKLAIVALLAVLALPAQTTTLALSGPATARAGATVTLALSATGTTNTGAVGFQWTVGYPSGGYTATVAPGPTATAASKTPTCTADNSTCLAVGMNTTVIANGVLANYSLKVPAAAPGGTVTVGLGGLVGANSSGMAIPTAAGPVYTLTILDRRDLNGDVTLMSNEVIASQTNPSACVDDMNGDGKCDLLDVIAVLLKALGGS